MSIDLSRVSTGRVVGYMRQAGCADAGDIGLLREFGVAWISVGVADADFARMLAGLVAGDTLVVPALDHLELSMWRVFDVLDDLASRDVSFVSIREGVDTRDAAVAGALRAMRSMLDAERRLVARKSAQGRAAEPAPTVPVDHLLERSRAAAAPWIEDVRENRPRLTWEELVDRVERSGRDAGPLSVSLMRRHVRRLVAAGDLPRSVLDRAQRGQDDANSKAALRARELQRDDPVMSLRAIAAALDAEGVMPPRAEGWSAQTVKRLLEHHGEK